MSYKKQYPIRRNSVLSEEAVKNRFIIFNSQFENIKLNEHKELTGLVFIEENLLRKCVVKSELESVADFILSDENNKLVLSTSGQGIISAVGSHLDRTALNYKEHDKLLNLIEQKRRKVEGKAI